MSFEDCIAAVAHHIADWDVPHELLPLTLTNEASRLAQLDSDRRGAPVGD
jgi:hypothetical protein